MRWLLFLPCVAALGCGGGDRAALDRAGTATAATVDDSDNSAAPYQAVPVPDLRTRKSGDDWPRFLGPQGNSTSRETGILTDWSASGLRIVWQRKLGTSYGIGTTSKGRFFQFDRYGDKARLSCLNSETGEPLWDFEYPSDFRDLYGYNNGPRCCPVVDGDRVYIFGAEGMLHCLRVTDGSLVWKIDTSEKFGVVQNFFGVGSTPAIEENLLIVQVGGSPKSSQRVAPGQLDQVVGNGSGIVAFDKYTGNVCYQISDELASYAAPRLTTINGRRWGFCFMRGGLVGFEPSTGEVDFHYPWRARSRESVNASSPVVVADEVFISETYGPGSSLLKVRPGAYDVVWRDSQRKREKAMQTHWNTPIHHEGYLYASSGRHHQNAELRCIELKTGKVMWSVPDLTRSSLLYVEGHFVCLSENGILRLLRANSKKYDLVSQVVLRDQSQKPGAGGAPLLKYPAWAAPILSHGLLYVRGNDRLVCLDLIPEKTRD